MPIDEGPVVEMSAAMALCASSAPEPAKSAIAIFFMEVSLSGRQQNRLRDNMLRQPSFLRFRFHCGWQKRDDVLTPRSAAAAPPDSIERDANPFFLAPHNVTLPTQLPSRDA
jgi:hypothetical protein